jgi:hypothetical protein
MLTGRKLALTLAFTVLVALATGVSCKGFFPNPTLTTVTIQPTSPQIQEGKTLTLQAWGTYDDGSRSQITSGVSWSSDSVNVTFADPASAVATGSSLGTATISASAQGVPGTATATVYLVVTSLTVSPNVWHIPVGTTQTNSFTVLANSNIDVTSGAIFTPSNTTSFSCPSNTDPVVCTGTNVPQGTYTITVTYPGTTLAPVITVDVP